jgi:hypothetical protein
MSSGSGVFDLEGDATSVIQAYRAAQAELQKWWDLAKKLQSAKTQLTDEEISNADTYIRKMQDAKHVVDLLAASVKDLMKQSSSGGAIPGLPTANLADDSFRQHAKEVDEIRNERMMKEGQARAQEELEINRIVTAAKEGIQSEIDSENLRFYEWTRHHEAMMLQEQLYRNEESQNNNRAIIEERRRADQWIASTKQMIEADESKARIEEQQIFEIATSAQIAIEKEAEAEAMRHAITMDGRKDEQQIIASLALLSKQEVAGLVKLGAATADMATSANKLRETLPHNVQGYYNVASGANKYREVIGQLSYAIGDFLSVNGDMADRIRAVANNAQYAAMMIGGAWGMTINIITLGVQLFSQLAKHMGETGEAAKAHAADVGKASDAYVHMRDELDKLIMTEEEYARKKKARELSEDVGAAKKGVEAAQQQLIDARLNTLGGAQSEAGKQIMSGGIWDATKATGNFLWQGTKKTVGQAFDADSAMDSQRKYEQAIEGMKGAQENLKNVSEASQRVLALSDHKETVKEALKDIGPAKDSLKAVYEREAIDKGMPEALKHLEQLITQELPEKFRTGAHDAALTIAGEGSSDLHGKQLVAKFDGRSESQRAADAAKVEVDAARMKVEQERLKANQDHLHVGHTERKVIQGLENVANALDLNYKKLKAQADAEELDEKNKLIQGPVPQRPPPINRNGNL